MIHTSNNSKESHFHDSKTRPLWNEILEMHVREKREGKKEKKNEWMNGWTKQMIFSYLSKHMEFQVNESFCQLFCVQTFNSVIFGLYLHCFAHVLSYSHARTHTQLHTIYKWNAKKLECLFSKDGKINQCYIGQGRDICWVAKITESEIKSSVYQFLEDEKKNKHQPVDFSRVIRKQFCSIFSSIFALAVVKMPRKIRLAQSKQFDRGC